MARKLHEDAGVPLGPCGHKALEKFQAYLSPDYQFKVMATSFPYMGTYQGPYHRKINPDTSVYVDPPVFVYAYFEAMLTPGKTHLPILVCAATSVSDTIHSFYGPECTEEFLAFLTELTVNEYGEERPVICIFQRVRFCLLTTSTFK